ncbi:Translation initiation factor 3 subunit J component [Coemansia sp. RSA 552]|nr:Translation initiation factor 3 subunit J component [Coemansia sp. RSA 552]
MSDWENLSSSDEGEKKKKVVLPKSKWGDEDESDSAPEAWDMSSSESEDEKPAAAPQKKKKSMGERIAERQAERAASKEAAEAEPEDAVERKLRERQLEIDGDLDVAEDLFSGLTVKDTQIKDGLQLNPKTQDEFDQFRAALVEKIQTSSDRKMYAKFLELLVRDLAGSLRDVEIRKMSSSLTALAGEKQKAARELAKGKKGGKKAVAMSGPPKEQLDTQDYSRGYDDFDDFM